MAAVDVETYLAPDCQYEYNALPGYEAGTEPSENMVTKTWTVDENKEYLFMLGIHAGD